MYREGQRSRRFRLPQASGTLRTGDKLRIEISLARPAYAYLYWIDSEGLVSSLFPEQGQRDERVDRIVVPSSPDSALPVVGSEGTEVCVLVRRDSPLRHSYELLDVLRPPLPFPTLEPDTILVEGRLIQSTSPEEGPMLLASDFPSPEAWMAGERPRGVGSAEPLDGATVLEYFEQWSEGLPPALGKISYLAVSHQP